MKGSVIDQGYPISGDRPTTQSACVVIRPHNNSEKKVGEIVSLGHDLSDLSGFLKDPRIEQTRFGDNVDTRMKERSQGTQTER